MTLKEWIESGDPWVPFVFWMVFVVLPVVLLLLLAGPEA